MFLDYSGLGWVFGRVGDILSHSSVTTTPVTSTRRVEKETVKLYLDDYGHTFYAYVGTALDRASNFLFKVQKPDGN
jgi:hypothetical protein